MSVLNGSTLSAGTTPWFSASKRAATAKSSSEEMKQRRHQREAATAAQKPGAATAHLTFAHECPPRIALLKEDEAALVMLTKPTRLPDLILQSPHEAVPTFHEDWTVVEGSDIDPEKWEKELRLRDSRNRRVHLPSYPGCNRHGWQARGNEGGPWSSRTTRAPSILSRL